MTKNHGNNFQCIECNGPTRIIDSRKNGIYNNSIRRRRQCTKCNHRMTTIEAIEDINPLHEKTVVISKLKNIKEQLKKIINHLEDIGI